MKGPNSRMYTSDVFSPKILRFNAKQAKTAMHVKKMTFGIIAGTTEPRISKVSWKNPSCFGFTIILGFLRSEELRLGLSAGSIVNRRFED